MASLDICPGRGLLDHMVALYSFIKAPPYGSPHEQYAKAKDMTLKDELHGSVDA